MFIYKNYYIENNLYHCHPLNPNFQYFPLTKKEYDNWKIWGDTMTYKCYIYYNYLFKKNTYDYFNTDIFKDYFKYLESSNFEDFITYEQYELYYSNRFNYSYKKWLRIMKGEEEEELIFSSNNLSYLSAE